MTFLKKARLIRRFTTLGVARAGTLELVRAFIEDFDRLLKAVENDNVKEEVGPYTARILRLVMDRSLIQAAVHETFISMRKYGESLDLSPKREEEIEEETEEEPFTIKEKGLKSPVGDYFVGDYSQQNPLLKDYLK